MQIKSNISFFGTTSERKDVLKQVLNIIPLSQFVYLLNEDEELFKDAVLSAVAINNYGTLKESNPIIELLINEKNRPLYNYSYKSAEKEISYSLENAQKKAYPKLAEVVLKELQESLREGFKF